MCSKPNKPNGGSPSGDLYGGTCAKLLTIDMKTNVSVYNLLIYMYNICACLHGDTVKMLIKALTMRDKIVSNFYFFLNINNLSQS